MSSDPRKVLTRKQFFALLVGAAFLLQACGQQAEVKPIKIDGSSTVYPITEAVVKAYKANPLKQNGSNLEVQANFSGTGGGFRKFCEGATDINGASRPISREEMAVCNRAEVRYIELPIAFDAITVVVNPKNNWVESITVEELKQMWQPAAQGKIVKWNQVRSSWTDKPLNLFGPGKDSGTFDYFTEAIIGKGKGSRTDYVFSEDDDALVNGISQDPNALGYFGFIYYERNQDKLKALAIDNGSGPVLPSRKTVENAQYQPLTRPLFIYVNAKKAQENPALEDFVEFYLEKAPDLVVQVGYIPLPAEGYHLAKIHFQRFKVGTVFGGKSEFNLTIGELLRKQAEFEPK